MALELRATRRGPRGALRKRIAILRGGSFGAGVALLASGTALGQLVSLIAYPVLGRLYTPAGFGTYALVSSVVSVIATVASLRFEYAIPLARSHAEAKRLTHLALILALTSAAATGLLLSVFGALVAAWTESFFDWWLWLVPLLSLATSVFIILSQVALRTKSFGLIASRTLLQSTATAGAQVGLGFVSGTPLFLGLGLLVGRVVAIGRMAVAAVPVIAGVGGPIRSYAATVRKFWRFPTVMTASALLNVAGVQVPIIFIGVWFGTSAAGALGLAQGIVLIPMTLIGTAVGQVFWSEISESVRTQSGSRRSTYLRTSTLLAGIGVPCAAVLLTLAPMLFPVIFGAPWELAGRLAQGMALSACAGLIVAPVSTIFLALERSAWLILFDTMRLVLVAGAGYLAYRAGAGVVTSVWSMYLAQFVTYGATWLVGFRIAGAGARSSR